VTSFPHLTERSFFSHELFRVSEKKKLQSAFFSLSSSKTETRTTTTTTTTTATATTTTTEKREMVRRDPPLSVLTRPFFSLFSQREREIKRARVFFFLPFSIPKEEQPPEFFSPLSKISLSLFLTRNFLSPSFF